VLLVLLLGTLLFDVPASPPAATARHPGLDPRTRRASGGDQAPRREGAVLCVSQKSRESRSVRTSTSRDAGGS